MKPYIVKCIGVNVWLICYPDFPQDSYEGWSQPFYSLDAAKAALTEAISTGKRVI